MELTEYLNSGPVSALISGFLSFVVTRHYYKKQIEDKKERGKSKLRFELTDIKSELTYFYNQHFLADAILEAEKNDDGPYIGRFRSTINDRAISLENILVSSDYYFERDIRRKVERLIENLKDLREYRFELLLDELVQAGHTGSPSLYTLKITESLDLIEEIIQKLDDENQTKSLLARLKKIIGKLSKASF